MACVLSRYAVFRPLRKAHFRKNHDLQSPSFFFEQKKLVSPTGPKFFILGPRVPVPLGQWHVLFQAMPFIYAPNDALSMKNAIIYRKFLKNLKIKVFLRKAGPKSMILGPGF